MPNQERVLHGLDSCGFYDGIPNICEVTECPYRDNKCGCVHELAHDAGLLISELLKAQEPRVMTLEEFRETGYNPKWLEFKDSELGKWTLGNAGHDKFFDDQMPGYLSVELYSKTWRCWTSKPSLKQMEETPWE